ncbi:hypothetical protein EXIGLDRAFT_762586 [Exidia glandulosa HHB12029]|uniref:Uncharacterized protein n=1 Tax=Exidia glandulosa HHB12029 TaxID=1314781 RepID=A0A166BAV7_EXIGL|nr:hypothetical protein EXIGLDRAFT_762586 [Exidia glandulosa HHB12029]
MRLLLARLKGVRAATASASQQVDRNETPRPHIVAISTPIPSNTSGVPCAFWCTVRIHWGWAVTTVYPTSMLKSLTSTVPVSVKTMPFESYVRAYDPLAPVEAVKRPVVPASSHDKHDSESVEEPLLLKVKEGTAKAMPAAKA